MSPANSLELSGKASVCEGRDMFVFTLREMLPFVSFRPVFHRLHRGKTCPQKSKPRNSYPITNVNTV